MRLGWRSVWKPAVRIDSGGRASGAVWVASPNFDARPEGVPIDLLVVHGISLPPGKYGGEGIKQLFTNVLDCDAHPYFGQLRGLRVSSHFLVDRAGALVQFVSCNDRAWHAGVSSWRGRSRCNDFSVGIELEGVDDQAYADEQYATLVTLTRALCARYPIVDLAGHSELSPGRKTDPGTAFDWARYRANLRG
jgi:AmpD protein